MCPDITAVRGNINRNVTDNLDALLIGIGMQLFPLGKEQVLHKDIEINFRLQLKGILPHRLRVTLPDGFVIPVPQCLVIEILFQGHKHGIIFHPVPVIPTECRHFAQQLHIRTVKCTTQNRKTGLCQLLIIHAIRIFSYICILQILLGQQTHLCQHIKINKIWIACCRREALVRAVTKAGLSKGQYLPVGLAAITQKINKIVGILAHGANAVWRWQG